MLFFKKKTQGGDGAAWGQGGLRRGGAAGAQGPGASPHPAGGGCAPVPPVLVAVPVAHIWSQLCSQPPPWELSRPRADGAGSTCASAQPAATGPGRARQGHPLPWGQRGPHEEPGTRRGPPAQGPWCCSWPPGVPVHGLGWSVCCGSSHTMPSPAPGTVRVGMGAAQVGTGLCNTAPSPDERQRLSMEGPLSPRAIPITHISPVN